MAVAEDVDFPETEAASIALHIVNAEMVDDENAGAKGNMDLVVKSTEVIDAVTGIIERTLGETIDRCSYSYARFVTHMRFLISRLIKGEDEETRNSDLFKRATSEFSDAYACARAIDEYMRATCGWHCTDEELLYLMMHINRLCPGH